MRFALRTNYGEGEIWLLQDKTVKFSFIEQFNTQKAHLPRLLLFLYSRAARLFFMRRCYATVRERFNIISSCLTARFRQAVAHCVTARFAKTVEKSGNEWYNELIRADDLPDKSEFMVK